MIATIQSISQSIYIQVVREVGHLLELQHPSHHLVEVALAAAHLVQLLS